MPADSSLDLRLRRRLSALERDGLLRTMRAPAGIDLSSNDYLNLAGDPRVRSAFVDGLARHGCGSTGSRLLRGERETFQVLEDRFARFKGASRSLFFSSGYLANLAVLTTLADADDVIFSDERNHASIIDGARLSRASVVVSPHGDLERLRELMETAPCRGIRFVVIESVYSMDGDLSPLPAYVELCRAFDAVLVVDEAHAVGVFGTRGSGRLEAEGIEADAVVSINTAGKALGVGGAFVAATATIVEYLVQRARPFVFSTAAPPAMADAIGASLSVVAGEPERREGLLARSARFREHLRDAGLNIGDSDSQIIPILIGENQEAVRVAGELQRRGFDVRAIRPPSVPAGTARLRLSLNAGLTEQVLAQLADALAAIVKPAAAEA